VPDSIELSAVNILLDQSHEQLKTAFTPRNVGNPTLSESLHSAAIEETLMSSPTQV